MVALGHLTVSVGASVGGSLVALLLDSTDGAIVGGPAILSGRSDGAVASCLAVVLGLKLTVGEQGSKL